MLFPIFEYRENPVDAQKVVAEDVEPAARVAPAERRFSYTAVGIVYGNPKIAVVIFNEALRSAIDRQTQIWPAENPLPTNLNYLEHSFVSSCPNPVLMVLEERIHVLCEYRSSRAEDSEHRRLWAWLGIETRQPPLGRHPVIAAARLEEGVHDPVGQSLVNAVVRECVAIKARQAFCSAKPEKAPRVALHAANLIARQSIGGAVNSNWKLLSPREGRKREQRERKLHEGSAHRQQAPRKE